MGLNISVVGFLTTSCYVIILGFLWRALAAKLHDNVVGQAMATIF